MGYVELNLEGSN